MRKCIMVFVALAFVITGASVAFAADTNVRGPRVDLDDYKAPYNIPGTEDVMVPIEHFTATGFKTEFTASHKTGWGIRGSEKYATPERLLSQQPTKTDEGYIYPGMAPKGDECKPFHPARLKNPAKGYVKGNVEYLKIEEYVQDFHDAKGIELNKRGQPHYCVPNIESGRSASK
jgi:hypothetical protein